LQEEIHYNVRWDEGDFRLKRIGNQRAHRLKRIGNQRGHRLKRIGNQSGTQIEENREPERDTD